MLGQGERFVGWRYRLRRGHAVFFGLVLIASVPLVRVLGLESISDGYGPSLPVGQLSWLFVFAGVGSLFWALIMFRVHVDLDGERIVVQNPVSHYEIPAGEAACVASPDWRRAPRLVLRDGSWVPMVAFRQRSLLFSSDADLQSLATALSLPWQKPDVR